MDRKKAWNIAFESYIRSLDAQKPVLWLGDLNVAPTSLGAHAAPLPKFLEHRQYTTRHQAVEAKLQQIRGSHGG